ncbi:hypothetical protein [Neobacillus citreus]|uniref:Transmembrane protein n=1 Tax=Neobacillus citreus TaxID=2833578 RepID=A0A942TAD0_9BACI|nr:hypothetical protein [Neobacillus citreus]
MVRQQDKTLIKPKYYSNSLSKVSSHINRDIFQSLYLNKKEKNLNFFFYFCLLLCAVKKYTLHFSPTQTRIPPFAVKIKSFLFSRFSPFFSSKTISFSGFFHAFFHVFYRVKIKIFLLTFFSNVDRTALTGCLLMLFGTDFIFTGGCRW